MINSKTLEPYIGEPDIERLISVIRREPVDRVPNFEVLYEDQHVEKFLGRYAGNTLSYGGDPAKGADAEQGRPMFPDDFIDFCEMIGQDVMLLSTAMWTPFMKKNEKGELITVADKSIKTRAKFEELTLASDLQIEETIKYMKEYKSALLERKSKIGVACGPGSIMQTLYEFVVGMNDFMMMIYEDRELIEEMLEESAVHFVKMTKILVDLGVDLIVTGDDIAFKTGLFVPPEIMKEIWVPRMAKIIEPAVNAGIPVMFHSDGKIDDIVEDLIEMGIDCIHPLDPYGIDYTDYKKRYGDRLCLSGNVDIEFPLSKGAPGDVDADVKKHMEILKPGYGYVATCSHSIVNYIPHENVIAYLNAIHKYGKY
jgi:uroporphyrinogen-III decarboxylase